jgi:hypothetical protein
MERGSVIQGITLTPNPRFYDNLSKNLVRQNRESISANFLLEDLINIRRVFILHQGKILI